MSRQRPNTEAVSVDFMAGTPRITGPYEVKAYDWAICIRPSCAWAMEYANPVRMYVDGLVLPAFLGNEDNALWRSLWK